MKSTKRTSIKLIAEAFKTLSSDKKEFLIGFAEGVIAARDPDAERTRKEADKDIA